MENSRQQFISLLEKYKLGQCSPQEAAWLMDYIQSGRDAEFIDRMISEGLLDDLPISTEEAAAHQARTEQVYRNIERRLDGGRTQTSRLILWAMAACILLLMGFGVFFFSQYNDEQTPQQIVSRDDVDPIANRATLTLADGRVIDLDSAAEGLLSQQYGTHITKGEDGLITYEVRPAEATEDITAYNTISTPRGGQYRVVLPDGSKVWLNASSSLTYPTRFVTAERRVAMTGEAYFEVAKNDKQPFVVHGGGQNVTVLGTQFNINAYAGEAAVATTLVEGAVALRRSTQPDGAIVPLQPHQQARLTDKGFTVNRVNAEEFTGWKDGLFIFHNQDLPTIIRQIERVYDVSFENAELLPAQARISVEIYNDVKLSELLRALEAHIDVQFEIRERRVMVHR